MSTDRDWEEWGSTDPYFGVLSLDQFRQGNLSELSRAEFFRTGENHVDLVLSTIDAALKAGFSPGTVLDFGCGVGRLLVPFARRAARVTGVDVSRSMLEEARSNCDREQITDVSLVLSDDGLTAVRGEFDLVHSCLVLPHIPWNRGTVLIDELLRRVRPGGILAIQIYYRCNAPPLKRALVRMRYSSRIVNALRNIWRRRPPGEPPMQLHVYDLPSVIRRLRRAGFAKVHLLNEASPDGDFESTLLFAQRTNGG